MTEVATNRPVMKKSLTVIRERVPVIVRKTAVSNIAVADEKFRAEIESLCRRIAPVADKTFVMMKNKRVWFDRNNAALYPKFDEFALPKFKTQGQPSRNYSVEFEGFHFEGMTRREALKSFVRWSGNPYLQDDGCFKTFSSSGNAVILTAELEPNGGVWITWSNGGFDVRNDTSDLTLVPISRLKGVDSPRIGFVEAVLLWLKNDLIPAGLSDDDEREYLRLMNENKNFLSYLEYGDDDRLLEGIDKEIAALIGSLEPTVDRTFVMIKNKKVWFDRNNAAIYPKFDQFSLPRYKTSGQPSKGYSTNFESFRFIGMTRGEALNSFTSLSKDNPYRQDDGNFRNFPICPNYVLTDDAVPGGGMFFITSNGVASWNDNDELTLVPIGRLNGKDSRRVSFVESVLLWLVNGLIPEGLSEDSEAKYSQLLSDPERARRAWNELQNIKSSARSMIFDADRFQSDILSGAFTDKIADCDFNITTLTENVLNGQAKLTTPPTVLLDELLDCDHKRADLQPYDEKILLDINRGHWDLFEPAREGDIEIDLPQNETLVARPPQLDVRLHGLCAIDFGTKSTIVVCRDRDERMLRIGKGDYSKIPTMNDFENPTVIELRDINSFLDAYRARDGRPFTEWNQVTVSHQAAEAIFKAGVSSSVYNSVFNELKQWAKDEQSYHILKDLRGVTQDIKPYLETQSIDGGDFDPIELYAYYLGLYINNMHHQIYLDYIMSFPVNYKVDVRERIRASFERGLKKSLPPALQADEGMMKRFRVYLGASEPAAYAISALECFKLEPKAVGEKVAYGVFDFGGGTTDFDFGIEYIPENRKSNFVIDQFGFNGDVLLGGENILELLAYEVYKDNFDAMRKNKIPFALPAGCELFAGAEALVSRTKDASSHMNNRILAEELRPIWERADGYKNFGQAPRAVRLFSKEMNNGSYTFAVELNINVNKLDECIRARIQTGVENFFQSMYSAFKGKEVYPIHIFLAGNSCKSPIVRELFDEFIGKDSEKDAGGSEKFVLHLPPGMEELATEENDPAAKNPPAVRPQFDMNLDRRRTGKTGVAFGLLRCRRGGKDVKINNKNVAASKDADGEPIFQYFLGNAGADGKTFTVVIGRDVGYGDWSYFTSADETDFEIYYTTIPRAMQGQLPIEEVSMLHCVIDDDDVTDDDAVGIYIRKINPNTIEYAVGVEKDFVGEFKGKPHREKLS